MFKSILGLASGGKMLESYRASAMLALLCMVALLVGCSGGGSTGASVQSESPEAAVNKIVENWRAGSAPVFAIGSGGNVVAQTTTTEARYIRFRDLSGNEWKLRFLDVVYASTVQAVVNTEYLFESNTSIGGLKIGFNMIKDAGVWYLDGLQITELPAAVVVQSGIKGVITDKITGLPVGGVRVEAYNQATNAIAGYAVTDSAGFYQILELAPATYYLVINRDGYEPYTILDRIVE